MSDVTEESESSGLSLKVGKESVPKRDNSLKEPHSSGKDPIERKASNLSDKRLAKDKDSKTSSIRSIGSLKNVPPMPDRKESLAKEVVTAATQTYLIANKLRKSSFKKINEATGTTDSDLSSEFSSHGTDVKPTDKYRTDANIASEPILVPFRDRHSPSSPSEYMSLGLNSHRNLWDCNQRDHFNSLYPRMERIIDISFDQIITTLDDYGKLDSIQESEEIQ